MNTTQFRRIGAIAGAAAFTTAIAFTGTTGSASAGPRDSTTDRPCFIIRSHWNNAEGPQPTCPKGRFEKAAPSSAGASRPAPSARIADFMP
jgi:hypothetical protein